MMTDAQKTAISNLLEEFQDATANNTVLLNQVGLQTQLFELLHILADEEEEEEEEEEVDEASEE